MSNNTDIDKDALLEKAIQTFDRMKGRIQDLEQKLSAGGGGGSREPIAVVGMACRFPGAASSPEEFWDNLLNGRNSITEVPEDRFDIDDYFDPDASVPGKIATRYGGFIDGIDSFDPGFFGISPREAISMDPQQRLLLEVAWEAFENAGMTMDQLRGSSTGVYVGTTGMEYSWNTNTDLRAIDGYSSIGTLHMFVANRLSYYLDLKGPSITLDTGCSSSLHTVHLACRSLRDGESNLAVAGGVNLILSPHAYISYSKNQMLSPDGQCFTFDSRANGFVRGEGCGVVVLKRLSDARADGDDILAVIRGSAVNQDGTTSVLTAPNGLSQEQCIRAAVNDAGIQPDEISCIEAHGTGTPLGDPIEVEALARVYGERAAEKFAYISSVKTNIGHLESAAGIAGLMKVILSLRENRIAPHLNYKQTNPELDLESTPFVIPLESRDWPEHAASRLGCVSSFGAGGSNSHIILEQGPDVRAAEPVPADRKVKLLTLSAQTQQALKNQAGAYADLLGEMSDDEWERGADNLGREVILRRTQHDFRLTGAAESRGDFIESLQAFARGEDRYGFNSARTAKTRPHLVFFFSGQGPTWWPLNPDFLAREKVFRESLERTDAEFRKHADWSLIEEMTTDPEKTRLGQSAYTQPALFAYQVAIAELWKSRGVMPDAVLGHSMGEVPAAHVAGALNLEDAVRVIYHRGRLIQTVTGQGRMAAVDLSMEQAKEAIQGLEDKLSVGANNGPNSTVLSGEPAALEKVLDDLQKKDIFCRLLESVDFASHSPQMEPLRAEFGESLQGIQPMTTEVEFYSTVHAGPMDGAEAGPDYWPTNLRSPVLFAGTVDRLIEDGYDIYLEIAPHPVLSVPVSQCLQHREASGTVLPSLRRNQDENITMWGSQGALHAAGYPLDWDIVYPVSGPRLRLPNYAWDKQKYWIDWDPSAAPSGGKTKKAFSEKVYGDWLYEVEWKEANREAADAKLKNNLLIFADEGGVADALKKAHGKSILVKRGDAFARHDDGAYSVRPGESEDFTALFADLREQGADKLDGVVFLWGLDLPAYEELSTADLKQNQDTVLGSCLRLVQALVPAESSGLLWIVTRDVHPEPGAKPAEPLPALLWGFGRTIEMEHGASWGGLIDLDSGSASDNSAVMLLREIASPDGEGQISYRGDKRFVSRLNRYELKKKQTSPMQLHKDGTYIVSGGQAGLGLVVAQWLAKRGAGNLVLTGRTELPPREEWDNPDALPERVRDRIKSMRALEAGGARVLAAASDVGSEDAMRALTARMETEGLPPVRGIIHAAAVFHAESLMKIDVDAFLASLDAKVLGAALLDKLFRSSQLDFLLNFSSVAALLGNFAEGMGSYSASNAFVDSLAQYRVGKGLPVTNVNWGLWEGAGSGATTELGGRITEGLKKKGIFSFSPDQGIQVMERLLGEPDARVGVLSIDWLSFRRYYAKAVKSSLLKDLIEDEQKRHEDELRAVEEGAVSEADEEKEAIDDDEEITRQDLILVDEEERRILLEYFVIKHAARVMRISEDKLNIDSPLRDLGLDSILAVELRNVVESVLEVPLPTAKLLDGSTINDVVEGLSRKLADEAATAQGSFAEEELSHGQRALWYQYSLHPQDPAYNVCLAVSIRGELNEDILKQSFQALHERHGILRSTFSEREGEAVRLVHDSMEADFFAGDASIWTADELGDLLTEASHLPFYAEYGPLCRCRLYALDDDNALAEKKPEDRDYILLLSAHMLIADGHTLHALTRELGELYFAELNGDAASLPALEKGYGDFVKNQSEKLESAKGAQARKFWEKELSGELPILQMPLDFPRPQTLQNMGETFIFDLPDSLKMPAASEEGGEDNLESYTRFLSAWLLLLHRYTQQNDILVGVPGLEHDGGFRDILGPYQNPVVIRANYAAGQTVTKFLKKTREKIKKAFANQNYPFSALVSDLNPPRYPGRNPIFQCMFELEAGALDGEYIPYVEPRAASRGEGFDMKPLDIERDIALHDLHLKVTRSEDGWRGELRYNSELFSPDKIRDLAAHYEELALGIFNGKASEQALSVAPPRIEAAVPAARAESPFSAERMEIDGDKSVAELFSSRVDLIKGVAAIKSGPMQLTYMDMEENANRLANHLIARGLKPGEPVLVFMPRSPEAVLGILAVAKAGGAFVPVHDDTAVNIVESIGRHSGAKICLLASARQMPKSKFKGEIISIPGDWKKIEKLSTTAPEVEVGGHDIAAILYGGREDTRGVVLSHRSILNSVARQMQGSTMKFASRSLQLASLNSYYFLMEVVSTWAAGATLIQPPTEFVNREAELVHFLIEESVERAFLPYSVLNTIAEVSVEQEIRPYYLREIYAVGERLYITQDIVIMLKALPGCELHYQYATMESGLISDYAMKSLTVGWPAMLPIGSALPGVDILILDEAHQPIPDGIAGQIYIASDSLAVGYRDEPELTEERFLEGGIPVKSVKGRRVYRSGLKGLRRPDGNIELLGRLENRVRVRGLEVNLEELEASLEQHPAIRQAKVVSRPDVGGTGLLAYIASRRIVDRLTILIKCEVETQDGQKSALIADDISPSGMSLVNIPDFLKADLEVKIKLILPGITNEVVLDGEVKRVDDEGKRAGIHFKHSPMNQSLLRISMAHIIEMEALSVSQKPAEFRVPMSRSCVGEALSGDAKGRPEVPLISESISINDITLTGVPRDWPEGELYRISIELPGVSGKIKLRAKLVWADASRGGFKFSMAEGAPAREKLRQFFMHYTRKQLLSVAQLRAFLQVRLPHYLIPEKFIILDHLPESMITGQAAAKADNVGDGAADKNANKPRTPVEGLIYGIWADIIGRDDIGIRDNFFDKGGQSLYALRVLARMTDEFNVTIPLAAFLESPTIADMAALIVQNKAEERDSETVNRAMAEAGEGRG